MGIAPYYIRGQLIIKFQEEEEEDDMMRSDDVMMCDDVNKKDTNIDAKDTDTTKTTYIIYNKSKIYI